MSRRVTNIVLAIGVVLLLCAGLVGWFTGARFMLRGEQARGIVVDMLDDGEVSLYPVVEFLTQAGEIRQHKGLAASPPVYRVGQYVAIRYLADDPATAVISSSFQAMWLGAVVAAVPGMVVLGVGLLFGSRAGRAVRAWRVKVKLNTVLLSAATLLLLWAAVLAAANLRYLVFGQETTGTVVDIEHRGTFHAVVEYTTAGGEARRHATNASSDGSYRIGQRVTIHYFEGSPTAGVITSSFGDMFLIPTVIAAPGAFLALMVWAMRATATATEERPKPPRTVGGSFVMVVAWCLLVLAMVFGAFSLRTLIFAETAQGVVTAVEDSGLFRPIVEFTTHAGEKRVHRGGPVTDSSYSTGDRVTVRYFVDEPDTAISSGFSDLWLVPTLFAVPGLVLRLIAAFMRSMARPPG
jgi:hypothetical protein